MTNEELIAILLEQQAKWMAQTMHSEASFVARMDRLSAEHSEHEGRTRKLESAIVAGVELVNSLNQSVKETNQSVKETNQSVKETAQSVKETAQSVKETNQSVKELAEAQKKAEVEMADLRKQSAETNARLDETNERLDIFINVLEQLIVEGRNGRRNGGSEK